MNKNIQDKIKKELNLPKNSRILIHDGRSNLDLNKIYHLKYVIKNIQGSFDLSATGAELVFAYNTIEEAFLENGWKEKNTSGNLHLDMRQEANEVLELLACKKLHPKKYKKLFLNLHPTFKELIESNTQESITYIRLIMLVKLFLEVMGQDQMKNNNLVTYIDKPFTNYDRKIFEKDWEDQPITKRLGLKSYKEFCEQMKSGLLECHYSNITIH